MERSDKLNPYQSLIYTRKIKGKNLGVQLAESMNR